MSPVYYYRWLRDWDARPSRLRAAWFALKLWWIGRQWFGQSEGYDTRRDV